MLTVKEVARRVGSHDTDPDVVDVTAAVNAYVESDCPHAARITKEDGTVVWGPTTRLGALMLAARWVRRRNSPAGVEAMTEAGGVYVSRHDSDIARLLRTEAFAPPVIG